MSGDSQSNTSPLGPLPHPFGRYLLLHSLGQGGMSDVYLAKQSGLAGIERYCVVKIVATTRGEPQHNVARFLDEARVMVHLSHQNICGVFDVGEVDGALYLAMDYVAGQSLNALLRVRKAQGQKMEPGLALFVLCELLKALDYAHRCQHPTSGQPLGIVHRDVSPQNILLSYEGEVKLIDFGIAFSSIKQERTRHGFILGKLTYISPEQARGEKTGIPADVFASGIIGYELITGERYYAGLQKNFLEVITSGDHVPRDWGKIEPDLGDILNRALRREPPIRYDSCTEFRQAVEHYQREQGFTAGSDELRDYLRQLFPEKQEETRKLLASFEQAAAGPGAAPEPAAEPPPGRSLFEADGVVTKLEKHIQESSGQAPEGPASQQAAFEEAEVAKTDVESANVEAPAAGTVLSGIEPTVLIHMNAAPAPEQPSGLESTVRIEMGTAPAPEQPSGLESTARLETEAAPAPPAVELELQQTPAPPSRRSAPVEETYLLGRKRRAKKQLWLSAAAVGLVVIGAVITLVVLQRSHRSDQLATVSDAAAMQNAANGIALGGQPDAALADAVAAADAAEREGVDFAAGDLGDIASPAPTDRRKEPPTRRTGGKVHRQPPPTTMSEKLALMRQCAGRRPCARQVLDKSARLSQLDFEQVKRFPAELDRCVKECRR
ncbi:MAG: protein kinase [Deltaproteobacteria bacterium]|nr:protein kinase [Deltaproteobacteria bacterium]